MGDAKEDLQRAATLDEHDVVRKLLEQHARIRATFHEVRTSVGEGRKEAFEELRGLLAVHEVAEEMIVRPVVRDIVSNEEADQRDAEEAQATKDLDELSMIDVGDPEFLARLAQLEKAVDAHAEAEETLEFEALQDRCTQDERVAMGKQLDAAWKVAPTRPHPSLVGHETAVLTIGPIAALVDRARDAIRGTLH